MPDISFYAGATKVSHLSGSGLGFFGGSFGQSVELNKFQDTTYITNGAGTIEGAAVNNLKYSTDTLSFAPSIVPATGLKYIPNEKEKYMSTKQKAFFKKKLLDWRNEIIKTNSKVLFVNDLDQ